MIRQRCAIYTRKSTEEGLEQDFNSLDAQREACAAYIVSQKHEGWAELSDRYDDGGFSGGTMDRPGLKQLLMDVSSKREASNDKIVSVSYGRTLKWRNASFNVTGAHDLVSDNTRFGAYLTVPTGKRSFVQSTASLNSENGASQAMNLTRSLGDGIGDHGYQAQLDLGDSRPAWQVAAAIRSRAGRAEAALRQAEGRTSGHVRFDGALVFMGGNLVAGNQIHDGFAIVDAGVEDVSVYLQNREVVRTNRDGFALVPGLSSYGQNRVSLNVNELPEGVTYRATAMDVVPARRSGAMVKFGGSSGQDSALVVLRDTTGKVLPVGSLVVLNGAEFVVGYDGVAFLEGLESTNTARVRSETRECTAKFEFIASDDVQNMIDPVVCK